MKSALLILPYFGRLPDLFPLYIKSVALNPTINFLIATDASIVEKLPKNVTVLQESFELFSKRFKDKISEDIVLESPYKLCDYRPAFAYILSEYVKEYDYWGYCDCDLIWGDIRKFIDSPMEQEYDKVLACGHLTLIRNTEENNTLFFKGIGAADIFKHASYSNSPQWFDEDYLGRDNIQRIFLANHKTVFAEDYSITPNIDSDGFALRKYDPDKMQFIDIPNKGECYYWENGKIFQVSKSNGRINRKEYAYMHFQQRYMHGIQDVIDESIFRIVPNRFIKCSKIPENVNEWNKERKFYFSGQRLIQLKKRIVNKVRRYM